MGRLFSIVPFRMLVVLVLGIDIVMVVALVLLTKGSDVAWWLALVVSVAVLVITLPIALYAMRPWIYLGDIDRMLAGEAWVHWHYDEGEWAAANQVEGRRNRKTFGSALIAVGLGVVVALIGLAVDEVLVFTGALTAGVAVVAMLVMLTTDASFVARTGKRGDIYITPLGVYRKPGGYMALFGFGYRLRGVELVQGERPVVRFDTNVRNELGATRQPWADVLVPAGREDEARQLVERFRTELLPSR